MELKRIDANTWEIPKHADMKVPAVIYASEKLLAGVKGDKTLQQAKNVACLRGIQRKAYVMPDAHQGYGFPIGGVAAFDLEEGVISPGGVGYDINCGVRLLKTDYTEQDIVDKRKLLLAEIFKEVPAGVGKGGTTRLSRRVLEEVCAKGAEWAVANGYGMKQDLQKTEENGRMQEADPSFLSPRALERGMPQLGTLGAGNHFLEIQKVSEIFDFDVAKVFGIHSVEQIMVMIRKGATRSFGPGRREIPEIYRSVGQPVLIPGSMGTASYILVGTLKAEELSFGSTAHGAGRVMSRHEAKRRFRGEKIKDELEQKGIALFSTSWRGIAEEAPQAYKDVDEVVRISHEAGIGQLVAKVVPVGVMKG